MKLVSEKGENRRKERQREKGERSRKIVLENLRGFEGGFRESAQSRNLEKFGDLGGILGECRKSLRRVLEEFRQSRVFLEIQAEFLTEIHQERVPNFWAEFQYENYFYEENHGDAFLRREEIQVCYFLICQPFKCLAHPAREIASSQEAASH